MKTMLAAAVIVLLAASPALAQWGYAPVVVAPAPTVAYYPPAPTVAYYPPPAAYYGPAPVTAYYGPAPVYAYPPIMVAPRPIVIVPRVYVPGQPVRNVLRAVF